MKRLGFRWQRNLLVASILALTGSGALGAQPVTDLLRLVRSHRVYSGTVTESMVAEATIHGIVDALDDPYGAVISIESAGGSESAAVPNVADSGILLGEDRFGRLVVESVLPRSAAESAGIAGGEHLLQINSINVAGRRPWETLPLLAGATSLTIQEGGAAPRVVELSRTSFPPETVTLRIGDTRRGRWRDDPDGEIAWLRIRTFLGETTMVQWSRAVEQIHAAPTVRRLVVDLRDNGGGDNSCIPMLGDFFLSGETLVSFESLVGDTGWTQTIRNGGRPRSRLIAYPAVVLVNEKTASLAEIFAAALRDNRSVPLVGTRSYGKGTTQTWIHLDGHYAVHLTTGRWTSPAGLSVSGTGLEPEVVVFDDSTTPFDDQLAAAIELLKD